MLNKKKIQKWQKKKKKSVKSLNYCCTTDLSKTHYTNSPRITVFSLITSRSAIYKYNIQTLKSPPCFQIGAYFYLEIMTIVQENMSKSDIYRVAKPPFFCDILTAGPWAQVKNWIILKYFFFCWSITDYLNGMTTINSS